MVLAQQLYPVLVFLVAEYSNTSPSFFQRVFHRASPQVAVARHIEQLATCTNKELLPMVKLPELGNITFEDVQDWILAEVQPANHQMFGHHTKPIKDLGHPLHSF